jgi:anti-sigma regulatory factor (Ser/Thr protein kinase)
MSDVLDLSPTVDSVAAARRWSLEVLDRHGVAGLEDTMSLLVSELVSNVVLHARTPCSLSVDLSGDRVRVEVRDGSDRLPGIALRTDPLAQSGRGLQLVVALSHRHGIELRPEGGKMVWFELLVASS